MGTRAGRVISRKGACLDRAQFEKMRGEYYQLRGWDSHGRQTTRKLEELGLGHVARELSKAGLIAPEEPGSKTA